MSGEAPDRSPVGFRLLGRLMWMRADREIDRLEPLGERLIGLAMGDAGGDRDHPLDAGRLGARDDGVKLGGEIGKIQMAMAIDDGHGAS